MPTDEPAAARRGAYHHQPGLGGQVKVHDEGLGGGNAELEEQLLPRETCGGGEQSGAEREVRSGVCLCRWLRREAEVKRGERCSGASDAPSDCDGDEGTLT